MWNTSAARLRISVHSSGPGIAQRLYFPAASGCPPTTMSLLRAIVVAVSAPGPHTVRDGPACPATSPYAHRGRHQEASCELAVSSYRIAVAERTMCGGARVFLQTAVPVNNQW